jgi:hypothetical protein
MPQEPHRFNVVNQSGHEANWARREFLKSAGATLALTAAGSTYASAQPIKAPVPTTPLQVIAPKKTPESLVRILYETMTDRQKRDVCFDWDFVEKKRGLLRTRIENNWKITKPTIASKYYTGEQQDLIKQIFRGMTHPDWYQRFDKQLKDDLGGFGKKQSIAIFGKPGTDQFEFVLASRHMTLRCDGNSAEHVAFGGPILYAHEGERVFEKPNHPGNVFWHQATEATKLFNMFDGKQRDKALVIKGMPTEEQVAFRGPGGNFHGIAVAEFSQDQKQHLQSVLKLLIEPFRQSDRDEVARCLKVQGGLDACHLAFYKEGDMGNDGIWDNWRLEGPSFVWYFRGRPHVHVWVNVADTHRVNLNAYQNSVGV